MRRIYQTSLDQDGYSCLPACISSLSHVELGQLEYNYEEDWLARLNSELKGFGLSIKVPRRLRDGVKYILILAYDDPCIDHAVIANCYKQVLHNPANKLFSNVIRAGRKFRRPEYDYFLELI